MESNISIHSVARPRPEIARTYFQPGRKISIHSVARPRQVYQDTQKEKRRISIHSVARPRRGDSNELEQMYQQFQSTRSQDRDLKCHLSPSYAPIFQSTRSQDRYNRYLLGVSVCIVFQSTRSQDRDDWHIGSFKGPEIFQSTRSQDRDFAFLSIRPQTSYFNPLGRKTETKPFFHSGHHCVISIHSVARPRHCMWLWICTIGFISIHSVARPRRIR